MATVGGPGSIAVDTSVNILASTSSTLTATATYTPAAGNFGHVYASTAIASGTLSYTISLGSIVLYADPASVPVTFSVTDYIVVPPGITLTVTCTSTDVGNAFTRSRIVGTEFINT